jgi:signal transduction histidine kinase/CheY-like chemotaxis protein
MLSFKNKLKFAAKKKSDSNLADSLVIAEKNNINLTEQLVIANRQNSYLVEELIKARQEKSNRADELVIANEEKSDRADELVIANEEKSDRADELVIANEEKSDRADELVIANEEKSVRADELVIANKELVLRNEERDRRADELVIANTELAFQNKEKDKRADELVIANEEKSDRADELVIANEEKSDRADELVIANWEKNDRADELVIANEEKDKRAEELVIANKEKNKRANELVIANEEKSDRAEELVIANEEKDRRANELVIANEEKSDRAEELVIANKEKNKRANELVIANKELVLRNEERDRRADELAIANTELAFQNKEKDKRADELVIANEEKSDRADELVIANEEKSDRADELVIANKELAFQNEEKDRRADELVIANAELAFQNKEKDKRADELVIANNEKVFLLRKLQLSQKMEALGKLTGGISHEYNNMLGIISGYSELIKQSVTDNSKLTEYANEIQHAGKRAAKLTTKLLACSQEKSANANAVDVNMLLKRQHDMLQKTLTVRINLLYTLHDDLWQVWLDGCDMEDTILNLCINAMHAMNGHGKLTIATKNENINQQQATELNITPGKYVLLSFTDTGCGFNEKTKEKIFDPFFTTKGEFGTGLGLSIVYGFVKNNGGGVDVHSVEGEGSQFRFYFPRHCDASVDMEQKKQAPYTVAFKEKANILLVDDEPALLAVTSELLSSSGYHVFCARDASEALTILKRESINILITDVIMQNLDGYELASIVKEKYPDIKIQIVSGFAESPGTTTIDFSLQEKIMQKPVDTEDLLSRIRELTKQIN